MSSRFFLAKRCCKKKIWLSVFKAMLGEVGVFEELYEDSVYRNVAKVILVVYLVVVAVMLLNLLIAVLR